MNKELNTLRLWIVLEEMKRLEAEHPKAKVVFDFEKHCIQIKYPLPADYNKVGGYLMIDDLPINEQRRGI